MTAMPWRDRRGRGIDDDRSAINPDLAARIGGVGSRHDLDERGLAGAVLAHQRVDLAGRGRQSALISALTPGKVLEIPRISSSGGPALAAAAVPPS